MLPDHEDIATVVVCEDDPATLELLCDHLTADRYQAIPAPTANDALRLCRYKHPDMLILDLGLPDAPGLDVLREIRGAETLNARFDAELPVIVLSGRGSNVHRVRGIETGADDYLVKPVHYPELRARIESVLRRRSPRREGPSRIGDLVIDPAEHRVTVDGRDIELSKREFALLRALAADPTRVFTKEELLRDVWGFEHGGHTRTLDSHASRLRRKLDPVGLRFVSNIWGVGYRLVDA
jgi:DNA-binding response OmpR family regulator